MTEPKRYVLSSIYDIASIPHEARERFYAELPKVILDIDVFNKTRDLSFKLTGVKLEYRPITWVDDGAMDTTLKITDYDGELKASIPIER